MDILTFINTLAASLLIGMLAGVALHLWERISKKWQ